MKSVRLAAPLCATLLFLLSHAAGADGAAVARPAPASPPSCANASAQAAATHHAGLVVTFGDRTSKLFCIEFLGDSISGLDLLKRAASPESGLQPIVTSGVGLGEAVCAIGGEGSTDASSYSACFGTGNYWAYYGWSGGAWMFSQVGSAQRTVHDGDIDGWAWGPGGVTAGAIPGTPGNICPKPTPTPITVATATRTHTPVPSRTATPVAAPTPEAPQMPPEATPPPPPDAPLDAAPSPEALAGPSAQPTRAGEVAALDRAPNPSATPRVVTSTSVPSPTAQSGVVAVDAEQGKKNAAQSQRLASGRGGAGWPALGLFVAVALALVAGAAFLWYRKGHAIG